MPLRIPSVIQSNEAILRTTAIQPDVGLLNVTVDNFPASDNFPNRPHYKALPHDTLEIVWTPASGYKPHLVSLIVSTEAAGTCYIYEDDTEIMRLLFNEKKSQPFGVGTDLDFAVDTVLKAKFVGDSDTPSAYITMVGHEHQVI